MAGSKSGGVKAAQTNKAKYGADFYKKIGQKGGKLGKTGGFAASRELARRAGSIGGRISRRQRGIKMLHRGKMMFLKDIAEDLGVSYQTIFYRYQQGKKSTGDL